MAEADRWRQRATGRMVDSYYLALAWATARRETITIVNRRLVPLFEFTPRFPNNPLDEKQASTT